MPETIKKHVEMNACNCTHWTIIRLYEEKNYPHSFSWDLVTSNNTTL